MDEFMWESFGDCSMGAAADDAANIIGSIGKAASGAIHAYGDTQGDQYQKVVDAGTTGLMQNIALIVGGVIVYKLLSR